MKERVIPTGGWIAAAIVFVAVFALFQLIFAAHMPLLNYGFTMVPAALAGAYALLIGYVYGDAKRRGMRYVMWTLLAIFLANGIGIILYFVLREPLPTVCGQCGARVPHGHAYCTVCGANIKPACPVCRCVVEPSWTHCASCGAARSL